MGTDAVSIPVVAGLINDIPRAKDLMAQIVDDMGVRFEEFRQRLAGLVQPF